MPTPESPPEEPLHRQPLPTVFDRLRSSPEGLSNREADQRLADVGPNILQARRKQPLIVRFLQQFTNFFALLLMAGGGLALLAEHLDPGQGNLYIAWALFGVVVLNALFTFAQEYQTERIMESFARMLPSQVPVRRDGHATPLEISRLVPGDVIVLNEGSKVPADGRLITGNEFKVDLSSLTGESEAVLLDPDSHSDTLLESRNMVFSGSLVQSGHAEVLVCDTGMRTQIGHIVQLTKEAEEVETPIRRELTYFIRVISTIAIVLGLLFFLVSVAIGNSAMGSLIFAIGIIVANVPEGLLPTVTLALTMASKRMARKQALVKNLESVETLGSTTVICTDKTGTLTQNRISLSSLHTLDRHYTLESSPDASETLRHACRIIGLCHSVQRDEQGQYTGDATEIGLLHFTERMGPPEDLSGYTRVAERSFSSVSKYMVTVCRRPDGHTCEGYIKGAPEVVLDRCDRIWAGEQAEPLTEAHRRQVLSLLETMADDGQRCLALAFRPDNDDTVAEDGYTFLGIAGMHDPARPEVPEALQKCRDAGIRVFMLTGDYGRTAVTIGRQIGLVQEGGRVIPGDELARLSDAELQQALDEPELIFARISPQQKLQVVKALQARNEVVTVTGDGVNDAPALKNADMGVAMGIMGTDVAKEASNMVLMDDNFATIVAAVEEGRTIFDNIKKFIAYILTSNIPEILPFIAFVLLGIPLPLTVVLILAIDLGTDILPALGLGAERPETDVMHKPPRKRHERLLTRNLLGMSYGIVGMIQAAAGFFSYFTVLYSHGWQWGQSLSADDPVYRTAITAFFASIVICQVADVMICRTRRQSLFSAGVFSNRLVLLGIAAELCLLGLISYVPAANTFFGTAPLTMNQLLLSVPFAIAILVGDEIRRIFVRRDNPFVLKWLTW